MKLKRCFLRYEPNIDKGTMFLFNKENGQMLEGDYYSYIVVQALMNKVDLDDLAERISFENKWEISDVHKDIEEILQILSAKDFIENENRQSR